MAKNTSVGTPRVKGGNNKELLSLYNRAPKKDMDKNKDLLEITGMKKGAATKTAKPKLPGRTKTSTSSSSGKSSNSSNKSTSPDTGIASLSSNNSVVSLNTSLRSNKSNASSEKSLFLTPRSVFKAEERPSTRATTIDTAMSMRSDNTHINHPLVPYSETLSVDRETISSFSIRTDISTASTIDVDFLQDELIKVRPGQIHTVTRPKAAKGSRSSTTSSK